MRLDLPRIAPKIAIAAMALDLALLAAEALADVGERPVAPRLHVFQRDDTDRLDVHIFVPYRAKVAGLAHYVEHLAWLSATKDWSGNRRGRTGAWANAHTLHYWISAQGGSIEELLETIGRVFSPIALPEQFALSEREIILREYRQQEIEHPWNRIFAQINLELYGAHPAAISVLGNPEDIRALDLSQARELHSNTHLVSNAAFLVEGNVSHSTVLRALRKLGFPESGEDANAIHHPRFNLATKERITVRLARDALAPHVIWRRVIRLNEQTSYEVLASRAGLLGMILSSNRSGGLAKALHYDQGIAQSFSIRIHAIDNQHAELSFVGRPDQGVTLKRLAEAFEEALAQAARSGIPRTTYDQVFQQHGRQWPDWEDKAEVSEYMKALAIARLSEWRQPPDAETVMKLYGQLPLSAIDELLRQLAGEGRTIVAFVGPKEITE